MAQPVYATQAPAQQGMGSVPGQAPLHVISAQVQPLQDVCQVSMDEGVHCTEGEIERSRDVTDVPVEELRPCSGSCCCISSLFCGFPSCIGVNCQQGVFIFLCKCTCCKLLDCKDEDKRCAVCCNCNSYLTYPVRLIECTNQICCVDNRTAIPCTAKVPCIVNVLGFNCCAHYKVKTGCCKKIGELIPHTMEAAGKA